MKMEAACSFKTMVSTYKSTRLFYPEGQHQEVFTHPNIFLSISVLLLIASVPTKGTILFSWV
jgi:hypothetical protein